LFNDGGAVGTAQWVYDDATDTLLAPADASLTIKGANPLDTFTALVRGTDDTGTEALFFNGDVAGNDASSAPAGRYLARALAVLGTASEVAQVATFDAAEGGPYLTSGAYAYPNLAVGRQTTLATLFGGGTGVLMLGNVFVEPNPLTPTIEGALLWAESLERIMLMARDGDKQLVSDWFVPFVFPSDADQVLNDNLSRASVYQITGVITLPRKITSQLGPTQRRMVFVQNSTAQQVNWAWITGATAACPAGKTTLVVSDGTNALALGSF
jgi:hypothetical protein